MSRMRNVQGVTRVTLAKSDKDTAARPAPAASTVNPCGKGAPPSFEMVIFFERSAVAAALADVPPARPTRPPPRPPPAAAAGTAQPTRPSPSPTHAAEPTSPPAATTTGGTP